MVGRQEIKRSMGAGGVNQLRLEGGPNGDGGFSFGFRHNDINCNPIAVEFPRNALGVNNGYPENERQLLTGGTHF